MFSVKKIRPIVDMRQPWRQSLEKRLYCLVKGRGNGKRCVVYLYEKADTSTFRYRAYNMCQVLAESQEWEGTYFFADELEYIRNYIALIDIVVIIRYRWTEMLATFINEAKRKNKIVVFDVDDLVYDVSYLPQIMNTLSVNLKDPKAYDFWFAYVSRIYLSAKSCDAFISTNEYIATHLQHDFTKKCFIMPNFFNREQEMVSESLLRAKLRHGPEKPFMIGYFSGTPSHQHDFATVALEIKELLNEFDDMQLKIVGFMDPLPELIPLYQKDRVVSEPLKDFRELQVEIAEVDVNIVPLLDNDFTNCKSELKYFEAGIVGTLTCAVPTFVYRQIVQQGKNGYLCKQGEWYSTIREQYLKGIDSSIIENARDLSQNMYGWRNQVTRLEKVLSEILLSH